ncbi:hypothetical protein F9L16_11810 [Agarivorans sp. B2Z047]|uniref:hypothetical protein n=1 Tax=Agarivorans sp. B2Z047 TaxID=2652721 RepID=UPI00128B2768|nr:hypothetical protein [Agarivorans sp. B2Z047]MPW29673.1 hypothetical protein [Agarivorans sp. B2Z047]UQN40627.1 hypothetical protein LQZ07_12595 [Agarivorans sp. B2Z047]
MHPNANPFEESKFNQTLLVDAFGQSYMFLPRHVSQTENLGELVNHSIDIYWAQSLLQNHSPMWGYQFDLNKLYFHVSGDYMASHKSEQQKIAWLSNGIVSGEVKVLKGKDFAPPPPSNMEGGMPVATLPESVVTRAKPAQAPLGQGGQSTEDIREALDLYCALPDGSPAANLPYKATLADGSVLKGTLDASGLAHLPNLKPNNVDVEFGEQPDDAAIAATRAEITVVLNSIIAAERAEGAKIAAEYGELNALQKGASSIGSLLTGVGDALGDAAEFTYNLIELGSMQGQLKRALNAGWDAYNVDDDKGWAESFASNWSTNQHQAYVKALGFDPASITKENLTEAYEIASFISDDDETQTALLQFVKDFADAQHHTELTEMGGAAIFDIVLGAVLVALTGGAGTAAVAANKVRHLDKLGGLFKTLAKQLKKKAQFKTKSGRTGGKVEQQIAKPAGAQVPTDAGKQKPSNVASHQRKRVNPSSFAEAENLLNDSRARVIDNGGYTPKYTQAELLEIAKAGNIDDKYIVRVLETTHAGPDGYLGKYDGEKIKYWSTTFDQLEDRDTDPRLVTAGVGIPYNPDPEVTYTLAIIDKAKATEKAGSYAMVPNYDNMANFSKTELKKKVPHPELIDDIMTPEFSAKFNKDVTALNQVKEHGVWDRDLQDELFEVNNFSDYDKKLFENRLALYDEAGANEHWLGNGLTKNMNNPNGDTPHGILETFSYDKNPDTFSAMKEYGIVKKVALTEIPGLKL